MIFNAWQDEARQVSVIKIQWVMMGVLIMLILVCAYGWHTSPKSLRIFVPPNLSKGVFLQADEVPDTTVAAFTYQIFTASQTWLKSGDTEAVKNITAYRAYFTARFFQMLIQETAQRAKNGALDRQRMLSSVPGSSPTVTYEGKGVWHVNWQLHLVETVAGQVVKDVIMDYPFVVVQFKTSIQVNPWGLAIEGYYQQPVRLSTNDPTVKKGAAS